VETYADPKGVKNRRTNTQHMFAIFLLELLPDKVDVGPDIGRHYFPLSNLTSNPEQLQSFRSD